jgi:hypothetical protein
MMMRRRRRRREMEGKDKEDMNETWPMCLVDSPIAYGN